MFVFKASWFPYILIAAGILLAAEGQYQALILTVAGAAWLYYNYKKKPAETGTTATSTPSAATDNVTATVVEAPKATESMSAPAVQPTPAAAPGVRFCSACGCKTTAEARFCSSCGHEL